MSMFKVEKFKSAVHPFLARFGTRFQSATHHIGLDIGSRLIKVVQLRHCYGEWQLMNMGVKQILTEKGEQGTTHEECGVKEALKHLIAELRIEGANVAISIAGPSVITKPIEMPWMSQEELDGHLELEIERYLPYERDDIYWDYFVPQWNKLSHSSSMLVYLVAAKREFVNHRIELVKESGLHPDVVDIDCVALANVYTLNYEDEAHSPELLVNFSPSGLSMITVGVPGYISMRDAVLGREWSQDVLQEASRLMMDDEVTNEEYRKKPKSLNVLLEEVYKEIANEIRRTMDDSDSFGKDSQVQRIWLCGGYAHLPGLVEGLASQLALPVNIADPFRKVRISVAAKKDNLRIPVPSLAAVATGLALRCNRDQ